MTVLTSLNLFDSPYTALSSHLADVQVGYESTRVENVLLDGTPIVQTVGSPLEIATVVLYCTDVEAEALNLIFANSTKVQVNWPSRYVTGYIRTQPSWSEAGFRYYSSTLTILVDGSGVQT